MLSCYFLVPISLTGNFRKKNAHTHKRYCFCNSILESWILFLWVVPIWRNSWNFTLRNIYLIGENFHWGKISSGKNLVSSEKLVTFPRLIFQIHHFFPTNFTFNFNFTFTCISKFLLKLLCSTTTNKVRKNMVIINFANK